MMTKKAVPVLFLAAFLAEVGTVPARWTFPFIHGPAGGAAAVDDSQSTGRDLLKSSARCIAISFGYSAAKTEEAIAKSVADVASYVCGDGKEDEQVVEAIAEATATAYAIATTEASVYCEGEGNADTYANAYARATQNATAFLTAYAAAVATSEVCGKCSGSAMSFGYVEKYVFLQAVSESQATIDGYADASSGRSKLGAIRKFTKEAKSVNTDIQKASATAFASAISRSRTYHDKNECFAWVNTNGCIYDPQADDPERCFDCNATAVSATQIQEIDGFAEASGAAVSFLCATNSTSEAEAFAEVETAATAVASVMAKALTATYAECKNDEGAYSCAFATGGAEAVARAVAEAFAEAWAEGSTCTETCIAESETVVEAMEAVLVSAATGALSAVCGDGAEGEWIAEAVAEVIAKDSKIAIAEAAALAVIESNPDEEICYAVTLAEAYIE